MKEITDYCVISHGEWSARVSPGDGGNLISLRYGGEDILRPLVYEEERMTDPFRHGVPILLPSNRTDGASFIYGGRRYDLQPTHPAENTHMHGLVSRQRFDVESCGDHEIVLRLRVTEAVYPFPLELWVTYRLTDGGCTAEYRLCNESGNAIPYTFGLHATFADVEYLRIGLGKRIERDARKLPTGRLLELDKREKEYCSGRMVEENLGGFYLADDHEAVINHKFLFSVSENFDQWILFRPGTARFLCIEPQSGSVNGLNMSYPNYRLIPANREAVYTWKIDTAKGK